MEILQTIQTSQEKTISSKKEIDTFLSSIKAFILAEPKNTYIMNQVLESFEKMALGEVIDIKDLLQVITRMIKVEMNRTITRSDFDSLKDFLKIAETLCKKISDIKEI